MMINALDVKAKSLRRKSKSAALRNVDSVIAIVYVERLVKGVKGGRGVGWQDA